MTRTTIDIDDELLARAMRLYCLDSKRETVDLALRRLVGEALSRDEALALEGMGRDAGLNELREAELPGRT